jgi:pyrophosphatase PpaX
MHNLEAILFDLDGTLIDSVDHIVDCWQYMARTCLAREMTREEILPTLGRTLIDAFEEIAPGRSDELLTAYRARQVQTHDTTIHLVPGTVEMLQALQASGLALGVATSKGLPAATRGLNLFGLAPFFNVLVTMEDSTVHKPNPEPLLVASERFQIEPTHILYVGDAMVDIQAGKAAGMRTAAVTWGAGNRQALIEAQPDFVFDRTEEVVSALLYEVPTG